MTGPPTVASLILFFWVATVLASMLLLTVREQIEIFPSDRLTKALQAITQP